MNNNNGCLDFSNYNTKFQIFFQKLFEEKNFPLFRQRNQIVSLDRKEFIEIKLIEIAALADKRDTSKHQQ
ncbi:unnamed protein product [Rotaria sordida]|uniref:Uncharacterized protein n=1 Tax=Rotaria sordida TaxID=392033 RepID=A0A819W2H3_9BILA|nr:unnamed protein product [Rotaria sordida]